MEHQEISGALFFKFKEYLQGKKCKAFYAPFDVRLPKTGETNTIYETTVRLYFDGLTKQLRGNIIKTKKALPISGRPH